MEITTIRFFAQIFLLFKLLTLTHPHPIYDSAVYKMACIPHVLLTTLHKNPSNFHWSDFLFENAMLTFPR